MTVIGNINKNTQTALSQKTQQLPNIKMPKQYTKSVELSFRQLKSMIFLKTSCKSKEQNLIVTVTGFAALYDLTLTNYSE